MDVVQRVTVLVVQILQLIAVDFDQDSALDQEACDVNKISTVIMVQEIETEIRRLQLRIGKDEALDIFGQAAQRRLPVRAFKGGQRQA